MEVGYGGGKIWLYSEYVIFKLYGLFIVVGCLLFVNNLILMVFK